MSNSIYTVSSTSRVATTVVNRTLRNTYALLGMLFVFASGTAFVAQALHVRIGCTEVAIRTVDARKIEILRAA